MKIETEFNVGDIVSRVKDRYTVFRVGTIKIWADGDISYYHKDADRWILQNDLVLELRSSDE